MITLWNSNHNDCYRGDEERKHFHHLTPLEIRVGGGDIRNPIDHKQREDDGREGNTFNARLVNEEGVGKKATL